MKIERIFSSGNILTNIKRCCLQIKKLKKLIFVNKNWPNDPRIGPKSQFNLLEFLERDMNLEEELEKFEREFEKDKVVEV